MFFFSISEFQEYFQIFFFFFRGNFIVFFHQIFPHWKTKIISHRRQNRTGSLCSVNRFHDKTGKNFFFLLVCVFIFLICVIFCCTCFGHTLYYSIHVSISKYKINKHIFFICNIFFWRCRAFYCYWCCSSLYSHALWTL